MSALLLEDIKQQIKSGNIDLALGQLEEYTLANSDLENEFIIYKGRYNRLSKEKRTGNISRDTYNADINQLTFDILEFVQEELSVIHEKIVIKKKIPVVIVVMTKEEARKFFQNGQDINDLHVQDLYKLTRCINIIEKYGDRREEWCPFNNENETIQKILKSFTDNIILSLNNKSFQIEFEFNTDTFFSNNNGQVHKNLEDRGCLFIIDAISMYNNEVYGKFTERINNIENKEQISMFVIYPMNESQKYLINFFNRKIYDSLNLFFENYDTVLSPHRGFGIGNKTDLNRNLKMSLEKFVYRLKHWLIKFEQAGIEERDIHTHQVEL